MQGQGTDGEPLWRLLQRAEVLVVAAGNAVELFGLAVVGPQLVVGDRPVPEGAWDAVAVMLAVLTFNLLGDALRDWLDPRMRSYLVVTSLTR